mgnify:CR=1 FL=1
MFNFIALTISLAIASFVNSDEIPLADSHGPISIMGDHMHKIGELMFSYRFGQMKMNNVANGTKKININSIMSSPNGASNNLGNYMNAPISMKMNMHMFGGMYAPLNNLTFMIMSSYQDKAMTQQRMPMAGSSRFNVNSSGIGDTRISALISLFNNDLVTTHFGTGLSLPTGSINQRDTTPASTNSRLGYSMQNGTGTYDLIFFLNNVNKIGKLKIGEQFFFKRGVSGKNSKSYRYGDVLDLNIWSSFRWIDNLSSSIKINYSYQKKMNGYDNEMNPRMSPAMDSYNQGHNKINLGFGVNFVNTSKIFKNHRIGVEGTFPIYQNLKGLQMREIYRLIIGWQYSL